MHWNWKELGGAGKGTSPLTALQFFVLPLRNTPDQIQQTVGENKAQRRDGVTETVITKSTDGGPLSV
jgi:hypothetical protein